MVGLADQTVLPEPAVAVPYVPFSEIVLNDPSVTASFVPVAIAVDELPTLA